MAPMILARYIAYKPSFLYRHRLDYPMLIFGDYLDELRIAYRILGIEVVG